MPAPGADAAAAGPFSGRDATPAKDQSYFLYDLTERAARRGPVSGRGADQGGGPRPRAAAQPSERRTRRRARRSVSFRPGLGPGSSWRATRPSSVRAPPDAGALEDAPAAAWARTRATIATRSVSGAASASRHGAALRPGGRRAAEPRRRGAGAATWRARERAVGDVRLSAAAPAGPVPRRSPHPPSCPEIPATVAPGAGATARVDFDAPVRAVAPGQSCVFYDGDWCWAGE